MSKDYHSIIELAIDLKEEEIQHFFYNQYLNFNTTNPDFIEKLNYTINKLDERFKELIERVNQPTKDKTKKNQNLLKINKDWSSHSFFYLEGILNYDFPPTWLYNKYKIFTLNKFNEIQKGFEEFNLKINNEIQINKKPSTPDITLKQKIHLLDKIGFFDLEKVNDLNETEKGKLVSILLYTSQKNTIDYIREKYSFNEKNQKIQINQLNKILTELGLGKL
jgi:hypothetical protein